MKGTISIQQVLATLAEDEAGGQEFLISFVKSTGKDKGKIKTVCKARYGAPKPKRRGKGINVNLQPISQRKLHIDSGTLPMTDCETDTYFTPLISHIIGFNGLQVIH